MLEALYEIGKIQETEDPLLEMTEPFGPRYKHLFKIVFNIDNGGCVYVKTDAEQINPEKQVRYLYRRGSGANAPDETPVSKITEPEKTLNTKILKSVVKFRDNIGDFAVREDLAFLDMLDRALKENAEKIREDLLAVWPRIMTNKDEAAVLSLAFEKNGEALYPGDLPLFADNLLRTGHVSNYAKFGTTSRETGKICYVCKEPGREVWGFAATFPFYTVDKRGMVTGGFSQEMAWKNYPLCPRCYSVLERGKKYLTSLLAFRFCGFNYYLIPRVAIENPALLKGVLKRLKDYKDFTLSPDQANRNIETEERILDWLNGQENTASFDFLFYEEKQSGKVFNILLHLEDITPSRLSSIVQAKNAVADESEQRFKLFTDIPFRDKKGERRYTNIGFSFHALRQFFNNSKIEGDFDAHFLKLTQSVFFQEPVAYAFLLRRIMEKIRSAFLKEENIYFLTLNAYQILRFLETLKILNRRRFTYMNSQGKYEEFFLEHQSFFDTPAKKALFLEGALVQKLLNIQLRERKAQPFRARLNGLKIDARVARRLLPETINKLEEYQKNYYKALESEISRYFLDSNLEELTMDEMSFCFVMGMNMAGKIDKETATDAETEEIQEENND